MHPTYWEQILQHRLTRSRLEHSLRVACTAEELARAWSADPQKAYLAGLMHDIARDIEPGELLKQAADYGIICDEIEAYYPVLLHGPLGAAILQQDFALTDSEILEAVSLHTTGDHPLGTISKIVFLADYIEPGRDFKGVESARLAAQTGLDFGVAVAAHGIITYLTGQHKAIHPKTLSLYNHYVLTGVIRNSEKG